MFCCKEKFQLLVAIDTHIRKLIAERVSGVIFNEFDELFGKVLNMENYRDIDDLLDEAFLEGYECRVKEQREEDAATDAELLLDTNSTEEQIERCASIYANGLSNDAAIALLHALAERLGVEVTLPDVVPTEIGVQELTADEAFDEANALSQEGRYKEAAEMLFGPLDAELKATEKFKDGYEAVSGIKL